MIGLAATILLPYYNIVGHWLDHRVSKTRSPSCTTALRSHNSHPPQLLHHQIVPLGWKTVSLRLSGNPIPAAAGLRVPGGLLHVLLKLAQLLMQGCLCFSLGIQLRLQRIALLVYVLYDLQGTTFL